MAQQLEKFTSAEDAWCTEAVFQSLSGVERVVSGYTGGTIKNPSYREVCMGTTGHAEVIEVL
ncbi:MAG: peptide-methionine (S)-S-oxide reductase [Saprospiraceae bacterium]